MNYKPYHEMSDKLCSMHSRSSRRSVTHFPIRTVAQFREFIQAYENSVHAAAIARGEPSTDG